MKPTPQCAINQAPASIYQVNTPLIGIIYFLIVILLHIYIQGRPDVLKAMHVCGLAFRMA